MPELSSLVGYYAALLVTYVAVDRQVKYLREKVQQHYDSRLSLGSLKALLFGVGVMLTGAVFGIAAIQAVNGVLGFHSGPESRFVQAGLSALAVFLTAQRFSEAIDAVPSSRG